MQIRWRFHGGLFFLSKKWTHFKLPTGFEAIMDKLVFYSNTEFTARFNTCLHAVTKSNSFFLKRRIKADEWLVGKHRLFLEQSFMKDRCEATWTEFQWSSFCGERSKTIIWKYLWDSRNNFILDVVLYWQAQNHWPEFCHQNSLKTGSSVKMMFLVNRIPYCKCKRNNFIVLQYISVAETENILYNVAVHWPPFWVRLVVLSQFLRG